MDRNAQMDWIRELAGNISDNLVGDYPTEIQAIHDEIGGNGTSSRYMGRGLSPYTGEYDENECMAHDLVDFALSDEGRQSWGIELPDWFDAHDRTLLVGFVRQALAA